MTEWIGKLVLKQDASGVAFKLQTAWLVISNVKTAEILGAWYRFQVIVIVAMGVLLQRK